MLRFWILAAFLWAISPAHAQFSSMSRLATGQWRKIAVPHTGVYKIDAQFLQQAGYDVGALNPQHLHIHGYGGGMLPQSNAASRPDDLPENAVWVEGEQDGKFDAGDYILFYGESADKWSLNAQTKLFEHENNLYADTSYYFICLENRPARRLASLPETTGATVDISQYDDYTHHERDDRNFIESGRVWWGEGFGMFGSNERSFAFNISTIAGTPIALTAATMGKNKQSTSMAVYLNDVLLDTQTYEAVDESPSGFDFRGNAVTKTYTRTSDGNTTQTVRLRYAPSASGGGAFLDYLVLNYRRALQYPDAFFQFRALAAVQAGKARYLIGNAPSDLQIWNVTDAQNPAKQAFTAAGQASFQAVSAPLQTYIGFRLQDVRTPLLKEAISNQNLHALDAPDALFLCPPAFEGEAERLAAARRQEGMQVQVVSLPKIYLEFSSGRQDLTALRDFIRSLYLKNPAKLRYILLLGDASFDYKNRLANNTNFVPVYESRESLHPIFSHSSDDYLGLLDANEGEWEETAATPQSLEVGIGRLPAKNVAEARRLVDKILAYQAEKARLGAWRNDIVLVADDGDANIHQSDTEDIAEQLETDAPATRTKKLYMDIYPQISTPNGESCPDLTEGFRAAVREGALIVNYAGHGSETTWAQEKLLEVWDIPLWRNRYKLPFFLTATCEFGRYDDPYLVSGAEEILLDTQGGGIGLITSTRPVFSSSNKLLAQSFYKAAFPASGEMPRLGDIIRNTKNATNTGVINRNYALLGDPTMRLAYPTRKAVLTSLPTQMKALQPVHLEGEIRENGALVGDFNGTIEITVYDKRRTLQTRGSESQPMNYKMRDITLFRGQARVENGRFMLDFTAPKDIRYDVGAGKVLMYAQHDTKTQDATGASQISVGGSYENPAADNASPTIRLYMDNPNFVSGGEVSRQSTFVAILEDDNGINISKASLGHEITAIIDGQINAPLVLNDYFSCEAGNSKRGSLQYLLTGLSAGKHTIQLKAWDIYNNSSEARIEFIVREKTPIQLSETVVFPNPNAGKPFQFRFKHDQTDNELQATLEIFDMKGRFVQRITGKDFYAPQTLAFEWSPLPTLPAGVYLYKLSLYSPQTFAVGSFMGKIVLDW